MNETDAETNNDNETDLVTMDDIRADVHDEEESIGAPTLYSFTHTASNSSDGNEDDVYIYDGEGSGIALSGVSVGISE